MNSTNVKTMGAAEWMLLVGLSIIWGGSFFFGMLALAELHPFSIVLGRVGIAAVILNLLVIMTGRRMPTSPKIWGAFFVMGALNNLIPFSLIFWAETKIPSGLASILNATTPLWTIVLAHFLTKDERLTLNKIGGVLLGMLGVVTMVGWDLMRNIGINLIAQCAVLAATVSYALAALYAAHSLGKHDKSLSPLVLACGQVTCSAIMMIPIVAFFDQPWNLPALGSRTIAAILGLAILSTVIAYLIYFRLLNRAGASNLLLVTFLIPVSALFLGILVLHETITSYQFGGMGLIGLGLMFIDGRIPRKIWTSLEQIFTKKSYEDYTI